MVVRTYLTQAKNVQFAYRMIASPLSLRRERPPAAPRGSRGRRRIDVWAALHVT